MLSLNAEGELVFLTLSPAGYLDYASKLLEKLGSPRLFRELSFSSRRPKCLLLGTACSESNRVIRIARVEFLQTVFPFQKIFFPPVIF